MSHRRLPSAALAATLAASLLAVGCSDNFGERCALPRIVDENCRSDSPDNKTSCVMTDNLSCDSRICAVWQDSAPFCTVDCSDDADCPGGSSCVPFFLDSEADKFCVLDGTLEDNPPPDLSGAAGGGGAPQSGPDPPAGEDPPAAGEGEGEADG